MSAEAGQHREVGEGGMAGRHNRGRDGGLWGEADRNRERGGSSLSSAGQILTTIPSLIGLTWTICVSEIAGADMSSPIALDKVQACSNAREPR